MRIFWGLLHSGAIKNRGTGGKFKAHRPVFFSCTVPRPPEINTPPSHVRPCHRHTYSTCKKKIPARWSDIANTCARVSSYSIFLFPAVLNCPPPFNSHKMDRRTPLFYTQSAKMPTLESAHVWVGLTKRFLMLCEPRTVWFIPPSSLQEWSVRGKLNVYMNSTAYFCEEGRGEGWRK